jgi:hypothetical protein
MSLVIALLTSGALAEAAIKELPLDGTPVTIKESKVGESYLTTSNYEYALGQVFDRWVYSPWAGKKFTEEAQAIENGVLPAPKRSMLAADLSIPTSNLSTAKNYKLSLKSAYTCLPGTEKITTPTCELTATVACHGFVNGTWARTFLEEKKMTSTKDGEFVVDSMPIQGTKCVTAMQVTIRGVLSSEGKTYGIKSLQISLKEDAAVPVTAKR